jgi:thiamine kinase-like enzyme
MLIPKIEEKIEKILQKLELDADISPASFVEKRGLKKHRYFSLCTDKKKERSIFFARIHNNSNAKKKFITEIAFLNYAKKSNSKIKKIVPNIKNSEIKKDFEWLERDIIKPKPLFDQKKELNFIFKKIDKKLSFSVFEISQLDASCLNFDKFNWKNYLNSSIPKKLVGGKIISKKISLEIEDLVKRNFILLQKENKYLSHGDLTLENIISDGKKIWIIDWERASLNNYSYDIGFLWSHLWEYKKIRKNLINHYLKKIDKKYLANFKILFRITVSYLALGEILLDVDKEKLINRKKRKNFFKKVLINSSNNFENLTKI